jgi:hypothetical protein
VGGAAFCAAAPKATSMAIAAWTTRVAHFFWNEFIADPGSAIL